jgi:hypothetical protein
MAHTWRSEGNPVVNLCLPPCGGVLLSPALQARPGSLRASKDTPASTSRFSAGAPPGLPMCTIIFAFTWLWGSESTTTPAPCPVQHQAILLAPFACPPTTPDILDAQLAAPLGMKPTGTQANSALAAGQNTIVQCHLASGRCGSVPLWWHSSKKHTAPTDRVWFRKHKAVSVGAGLGKVPRPELGLPLGISVPKNGSLYTEP